MANYDIPQYPTKRLRYFNNQFLNDQDFIDDDAGRIGHERAFLRSLCVAGVCEGLQVTYPAANLPPSVSAGVAIDKTGRMIVVDRATDALARPDALADGDYVIHISFLETEDARASGQGASDFTRWKQVPVINATAKSAALPDGAVVLGSCTVQNNAFVGSGTTVGRQYSGLRLPGPNPSAAATLHNNGAADDLALLGGSLTIRRDAGGQLGPTLTLQNSAGTSGAGGAIDFNGRDPGTNDPSLRIRSLDDGSSSSHLTFSTKQPGANTNTLVERLRLTSDGMLKFPNEHIKDKIVFWDDGTSRYGLGLNASNLNLFCPTSARFSLRQNSSSGTEVFSVSGAGTVTFSGAITPKVGNNASSGIYFPSASGLATDEAFLRYYLASGTDTAKLVLGINNDADDALVLWQAGSERINISNNTISLTGLLKFPNQAPADKIVIWDSGTTDRFGIGLNSSNINLFYPTNARFSLRQNSSSGTEVFSVDASGNTSMSGFLTTKNMQVNANTGTGFVWVRYDGDTGYLRFYQGTSATNGYLNFASGWGFSSDVALKTDIVAHEPVLDRVMKLRPVRFRWKANGSDGSGFIAQEVEGLFPDLVHDGLVDEATGRRMKGMTYERFGMLAIAAIKELKTDHDARLAALEQRLAAREAKS